jgi:hypothetical protein
MSMPGPDTLEPASGPATNGDGQLLPPGQSEEAPVATGITPYPSPLSTYLTRSELVPFVLELEKSLLVSREHDYAKAPDRLAVLQATALLERSSDGAITHNSGRGVEAKTESSRAEQCEELLNCCGELGRLRRSALLCSGENATSRHLRAVVGLQASLIREQQEQIYTKDRELASIRRDRDQLEARLERMERRLAVHQKRNTVTTPSFHDSESTPTSGLLSVPRRHSRAESLIMSERHVRSRSASLERTRNRLRHQQTSNTTSATPVSQDERKSARKRLRIEDNRTTPEPTPVKRVRKPPKLMEMRTSVEYAGLGLLPVQDGLAPRLTANHRDLQAENTDTLLNDKLCTASNTLSNSRLSSDNPIVVPLWEFRPLKPLVELKEEPTATEPEDISEDMFLRRHKKHEEDEKRRKRCEYHTQIWFLHVACTGIKGGTCKEQGRCWSIRNC